MVKAEIFGPTTYDSCANRVRKLTGILLIFHPGCGHCVQMRPEWEIMKRRLSDTDVVEVDGSAMSEHLSMMKSPVIQRTRGFPSIFRIKDGNIAAEYQGARTAAEMHKFASQGKKKNRKTRKPKSRKSNTRKSNSGKTRKTKRRKLK